MQNIIKLLSKLGNRDRGRTGTAGLVMWIVIRKVQFFIITFDDGSQIVVNKQEPLQELWLASKLGGYSSAIRMDNG